jgi:hypothetical protein
MVQEEHEMHYMEHFAHITIVSSAFLAPYAGSSNAEYEAERCNGRLLGMLPKLGYTLSAKLPLSVTAPSPYTITLTSTASPPPLMTVE